MRSVVLSIALLGCGQVTPGLADAPPPDSVDAAVAPVSITSLTQTGDGLPDTNVDVVFADDVGNLISETQVDAQGHAQAEMPTGGTVTLVRTTVDTATTLTASMSTITGVKPGDNLTFGLKALANNTQGGGVTAMTVNFPLNASAGFYTFYTACDEIGETTVSTSPATIHFHDSCHGATFDLLCVEHGGNLATPVFFKVSNITFQAGGATTIMNPVLATMQSFTATIANTDQGATALTIDRAGMLGNTSVGTEVATVSNPPAGTNQLVVPFEQGFGSRSDIVLQELRAGVSFGQNLEIITPTLTNSIAIDLAALELPSLGSPLVTPSGMTWTTVFPGTADGAEFEWAGHWATAAGVATTIVWRIALPLGDTGAALVRLPSKFARLDPAQQTVTISPTIGQISMVNYDLINGYDEFRLQPETLALGPGAGVVGDSRLPDVGPFNGMAVQRTVGAIDSRL